MDQYLIDSNQADGLIQSINDKCPNEILKIIFDFVGSRSKDYDWENSCEDTATNSKDDQRIRNNFHLRNVCQRWHQIADRFTKFKLCVQDHNDHQRDEITLSCNFGDIRLRNFNFDELWTSTLVSSITRIKLCIKCTDEGKLKTIFTNVASLLSHNDDNIPTEGSILLESDDSLSNFVNHLTGNGGVAFDVLELPTFYSIQKLDLLQHILQRLSNRSREELRELSNINLFTLVHALSGVVGSNDNEALRCNRMTDLHIDGFPLKDGTIHDPTKPTDHLAIICKSFWNLVKLKITGLCLPLDFQPLQKLTKLEELEVDLLHSCLNGSCFNAESPSIRTLTVDADSAIYDDFDYGGDHVTTNRKSTPLALGAFPEAVTVIGFTRSMCAEFCATSNRGRYSRLSKLDITFPCDGIADGSNISRDIQRLIGSLRCCSPLLTSLKIARDYQVDMDRRLAESYLHAADVVNLLSCVPKSVRCLHLQFISLLEAVGAVTQDPVSQCLKDLMSILQQCHSTLLNEFEFDVLVSADLGKDLCVLLRSPIKQDNGEDEFFADKIGAMSFLLLERRNRLDLLMELDRSNSDRLIDTKTSLYFT